jgi:hypothetical protein
MIDGILKALNTVVAPIIGWVNLFLSWLRGTPQEQIDKAKGKVVSDRQDNKDDDRPPPGHWGGI